MKTFLAFLLLSASAASAAAQEVIVEDEAASVDAPYDIDDDATSDLPVGPRVYGWSSAPANCGTFKYWNGEYCADARFEPPATQE